MPTISGFRDPLGDGSITVSDTDGDGYFAHRVFQQPDLDNGDTTGNRHLGIDWNGDQGGNGDDDERVYSAYDGVIAYIGPEAGAAGSITGWGGVIIINHTLPDGSEYTTVYGHIENVPSSLSVGKFIPTGTLLGDLDDIDESPTSSDPVSGGPGFSAITPFDAHLHFEVREGHQDISGLGRGYATATASGATSYGVQYADVSVGGQNVRYLDPEGFIEQFRTFPEPEGNGPDLIIENVSVADTSVTYGEYLTVTYDVTNIGDAAAPDHFTRFVFSEDAVLSTDDVSTLDTIGTSLDPGQTIRITSAIPTSVVQSLGSYNLIVVADCLTSAPMGQFRVI